MSLKRLRWSLENLLAGSAYASRFAGGVFTHSALRTFDYHRWHAPLAGSVLETRVIQGQAWLEVEVVKPSHFDQTSARVLKIVVSAFRYVHVRV